MQKEVKHTFTFIAVTNSIIFIMMPVLTVSLLDIGANWDRPNQSLFGASIGSLFIAATFLRGWRFMSSRKAVLGFGFLAAATSLLMLAMFTNPIINSNFGVAWLGTIALCIWGDYRDRPNRSARQKANRERQDHAGARPNAAAPANGERQCGDDDVRL